MGRKLLLLFACGLFASLLCADTAWAQSGAEAARSDGHAFSLTKIVLLLAIHYLWVQTTDWANVDCQQLGLDHTKWNSILLWPFLLGLLVFGLLIPGPVWLFFVVNYPLVIVSYAVPLGMYIKTRNVYVTVDERVMTADHIRFVLATKLKLGIAKEKKLPYQEGPPVNFIPQGAEDEQQNQANIIVARQSPGYVTAKELFADAVDKRAEKVMLDFTRESVHTRYMIDGVWHNVPERDRESGDVMLAVIKKMANLNERDRRAKQEGGVKAEYHERKFEVGFVSGGVKTGERALLHIVEPKRKPLDSLDDAGMREKMQERLKQALGSKSGLFLFCAPPGGGLTTSLRVGLKSTDRLLRDFHGLEEASRREVFVENVDIMTFDASAGQQPLPYLDRVFRKEPDVIVVPHLFNAQVLVALCDKIIADEKLAISTVRAKEAVEALLALLAMKAPPQKVSETVIGVLNTRLIRKLCKKCKEPYQPPPQLLQKLGIPPGRVTELWREKQPPGPDDTEKERKAKEIPCEICNEIGYRGRTAIFELLVVDDKLRQALAQKPQLDFLRKVARSSGHRTLQEEGIALLAQGITSLSELQRVLKQ